MWTLYIRVERERDGMLLSCFLFPSFLPSFFFSFSLFEKESCYVAQDGLELSILLLCLLSTGITGLCATTTKRMFLLLLIFKMKKNRDKLGKPSEKWDLVPVFLHLHEN
jgi:hypothetical protein